MSTDMQENSIALQIEAIGLFAARKGLKIIRTYEDQGRSGLTLQGRIGLQRLIDDVRSGNADFRTILIYDVSRWGRFQDSDESAYYEFVCRSHGVAVEYCAEQFRNDGSLSSSVLKALKRAMAGEFSRELSEKVFRGQSRVVADGFRIGSTPGYGLRRALVDRDGKPSLLLKAGQWKAIQGQHTILVPGPAAEVSVVQRIYGLFIDNQMTYSEIARELNKEGIRNAAGRNWSYQTIKDVLTNEKYIGNSIYNRASKKMAGNWRRNPRKEWVIGEKAYEPLVSRARFIEANVRVQQRAQAYNSNYMLDFLSAQWCRHGAISADRLIGTPGAPAYNTFKAHFGSLTKAYELIGYPLRSRRELNLELCQKIRSSLVRFIEMSGGSVRELPRSRFLLVNELCTVAVGIGRSAKKASGGHLWQFGYRSMEKPDFLAVARVEENNSVLDYFILPYALLPKGAWLTLSGNNYSRLEQFRFSQLDAFGRSLGQSDSRQQQGGMIRFGPVDLTTRAIAAFAGASASDEFRKICASASIEAYPDIDLASGLDKSLVFVVVWRFVFAVCQHQGAARRLATEWPLLLRLIDEAFNVYLERGPFPKGLCGIGRPRRRPFASERAALRLQQRPLG